MEINAPAKGMEVYRYEFTVPEDTVDENGHVNNVSYVQWMQDAAMSHSGAVGCTARTMEDGATWVVRSHRIEYVRPAYGGDVITVLTWVSNFRKVRSLRKYRFLRNSDGLRLASGETDWVYVDGSSGRPRAVPEEVRSLFTLVAPKEEP